jgi:hypothetical protein
MTSLSVPCAVAVTTMQIAEIKDTQKPKTPGLEVPNRIKVTSTPRGDGVSCSRDETSHPINGRGGPGGPAISIPLAS